MVLLVLGIGVVGAVDVVCVCVRRRCGRFAVVVVNFVVVVVAVAVVVFILATGLVFGF